VAAESTPLRVAFVPGVTVRKWTGTWAERHLGIPLEVLPLDDALAAVLAGEADLGFVRLPIDRGGLNVIRLYGEVGVVVVSRDSELADRDSVTLSEIADIPKLVEFPPRGPVKDAVALVAAGIGALRLPHSLARLNARKDVAAIPIEDAPETDIAIVWLMDVVSGSVQESSVGDNIEEFVGIVRGRTAASSRAVPTPPTVKVRPVAKVRSKSSHAARRKRKGR
jgi:DNA-binding transcriptional LysR family regulator